MAVEFHHATPSSEYAAIATVNSGVLARRWRTEDRADVHHGKQRDHAHSPMLPIPIARPVTLA